MKRLLAIVLVLGLAPAVAQARKKPARAKANIAVGSLCELKKAMPLAPKGKGKKQRLRPKTQLEVVAIDGKLIEVKTETLSGVAPRKLLDKVCLWSTPAANMEGLPPLPPVTEAESPNLAGLEPLPVPPGASADAATPVASEPTSPVLASAPVAVEPDPGLKVVPTGTTTVAHEWADSDKIKVAVMDLKCSEQMPRDFADSLTSAIPQTLEDLGPFKAISRADIEQMLQLDAMKQSLGCNSASCLAEIGGALGADYMVTGSLLQVGDTMMLQMQLSNIAKSRIDQRVSREYKGSPGGLFEEIRTAVKLLVRDVLAHKSGTLLVRVSEEGASIALDGTIVGVSPWLQPLTVPGGTHTVTIEREGFVRAVRDVDIVAQKESVLDVALQPSEEFRRKYTSAAGLTRTLAWAALGTAAVGLGAGAGLYVHAGQQTKQLATDINAYAASSTRDQATFDELERRRGSLATFDSLTLAAGGVALVGLVVGTVLLLTGDDPGRYEMTPSLSTSAGLGVSLVPGAVVIGGHY